MKPNITSADTDFKEIAAVDIPISVNLINPTLITRSLRKSLLILNQNIIIRTIYMAGSKDDDKVTESAEQRLFVFSPLALY